jgi:hypothetical protein
LSDSPPGCAGNRVPLMLALEMTAAHPDITPPRPGPVMLRELFEHLTGQ